MDKILIVDDDSSMRYSLNRLLAGQGLLVSSAKNGAEALERFAGENPDLVIMDIKMPGHSGLEVLKRIKERDPKALVILMTAFGTTETAIEAMKFGAFDYILKPFDIPQMRTLVERALEVSRMMKKMVSYPRHPEDEVAGEAIVGSSPAMQQIYKMIGQVAPTGVTVLLRGESGTGKELVARAIYHHSNRADRPFLPVNCAAIPETLLESELFGHEKGAFSGAVRDKVGLVQAAMDGTLFLDEIGDLPLLLQVKLLRFLQEGEVRPVGSNSTVQVNARVVLATNADLEAAILAGRFRQDLFYRIKGFPIHLKALRERKEDIRPLVFHFAQTHAKERGLKREFLEDTVKYLMRFDWPGNVRELEHEVKRAMTLASGEKVTMSDIHEKIRQAIEEPADTGGVRFGVDYEDFKERQRRRDEEEERRFLAESSKRARSVRELARDVLKVSNSTLQGRLKALGVEFKPNKEQKGAI